MSGIKIRDDFIIIFLVVLVALFGLITLYSISANLFYSQLGNFILGGVLFFLFSKIDYKILTSFGWLYYIGMILVLVGLLVFGELTRGSTRWFELGFFRFQPSEIFKPFFILFVTNFVINTTKVRKGISLVILLLSLPIVFLIFEQPDLGNAVLYFLMLCFVLVASGVTIRRALVMFFFSLFLVPIFWLYLADYQKNRVLTFMNPDLDPAGTGYNAIQSIIAVGSGQLLGKGVGYGTQSHLHFLPEHHTDFIFAAFGEEFGFLGGIIFLGIYFMLLLYLLLRVSKVKDKEGQVIVYGVFGMILIQAVVNIGMNVGLLPITGVTLPLVSYGGSSIISVLVSLGIVANILKNADDREFLEIH